MADTLKRVKIVKSGLNKVLTLKDLVLFGISSILGSGGFNLVGKGIQDGNHYFPLTLLLSGALFTGSAHSYSYANDTYKSNISETKLIENVYGSIGKYTSSLSILLYNIFASATILVLCSKILFPNTSWWKQVSFSLLLLSIMTFAAFQQLDLNKEVINIVSLAIILLLGSASFLGISHLTQESFKMPSFPSLNKINLYESLLYFFFVLAGHDALIKFSEEAKEQNDIGRSMYISIGISVLLVSGLCLAALTYIKDFKVSNVDDIVADIFEKIFNKDVGKYVSYFAIFCMFVSTFVGFLATIRYTYALPEKIPFLKFIREGGDGRVSHISILIIGALCAFAILINQTTSLVELSDMALIITLLLVSSSAFYERFQKGVMPITDGLTSGGLLGILGLTIQKHFL
uniref:Amino acid permease n=1 Tax=viral metagenome TaxID=1070528 RepID=A0A6C0IGF1_9ZZZZ